MGFSGLFFVASRVVDVPGAGPLKGLGRGVSGARPGGERVSGGDGPVHVEPMTS